MSDSRRATITKAILEVALVSIGVFLGMAADQWRSDRQHREQARDALQRFKVEVETTQAADFLKFLHSVKIWLDDIVYHEPALADSYKQILPLIESALRD